MAITAGSVVETADTTRGDPTRYTDVSSIQCNVSRPVEAQVRTSWRPQNLNLSHFTQLLFVLTEFKLFAYDTIFYFNKTCCCISLLLNLNTNYSNLKLFFHFIAGCSPAAVVL